MHGSGNLMTLKMQCPVAPRRGTSSLADMIPGPHENLPAPSCDFLINPLGKQVIKGPGKQYGVAPAGHYTNQRRITIPMNAESCLNPMPPSRQAAKHKRYTRTSDNTKRNPESDSFRYTRSTFQCKTMLN